MTETEVPLRGAVYLQCEYMQFPDVPHRDDDFIGPFPELGMAEAHQKLYGPLMAVIVQLLQRPDPAHTMTPGQAVDYVLARY